MTMKEFYTYSFSSFTVYQTPNYWEKLKNYNYIVAKGNEAVIFDPGELAPLQKTLIKNGLKLKAIFLTHHHGDHVNAVEALKEQYDATVYAYTGDSHRIKHVDVWLDDEQIVDVLGEKARVIFSPGHTTGSVAYFFPKLKWLFSGDILFTLGCGRVYGGTYEQMQNSIDKLSRLPEETTLFTSHEFTERSLNFALSTLDDDPRILEIKDDLQSKMKSKTPTTPTTLKFEKKYNPFLRTREVYIKEKMGLKEAEGWQVFEKLREIRNNFS